MRALRDVLLIALMLLLYITIIMNIAAKSTP